jgi:hypothetical protein
MLWGRSLGEGPPTQLASHMLDESDDEAGRLTRHGSHLSLACGPPTQPASDTLWGRSLGEGPPTELASHTLPSASDTLKSPHPTAFDSLTSDLESAMEVEALLNKPDAGPPTQEHPPPATLAELSGSRSRARKRGEPGTFAPASPATRRKAPRGGRHPYETGRRGRARR